MTGANVSDISASVNIPAAAAGKSVSKHDEDAKVDFLSMMAGSMQETSLPEASVFEGASILSQSNTEFTKSNQYTDFQSNDSKNFSRVDSQTKPDKKEPLTKEETETVKEAISSYEDNVKAELKESLDVTDEQIEQAMEELGLTFVDLTDPANLIKLIGTLEGGSDNVSLLVNDTVREVLGDITALSEELLETTELDPSALKDVEAQMINVEELGMQVLDDEESRALLSDMEPILTQVKESGVDTKGSERPISFEATETEDITVTKEVENQSTSASSQSQTNAQADSQSKNPSQAQQPVQNMTSHETPAAMDTTSATPLNQTQNVETPTPLASYTNVNTQNVIEQIVTAARTSITTSVRSMELQLNPMNLGRMLMQVQEQNGQITARLLTQNEAVKEALEQQLNLLKEQLNQQGIKVDAIEVTVATHEFEQNLEEGQQDLTQQAQNEEEQNNGKSSGTRDLNLNDEQSLEEMDLTEEEELTARIMKDEGNTVNFRA